MDYYYESNESYVGNHICWRNNGYKITSPSFSRTKGREITFYYSWVFAVRLSNNRYGETKRREV